MSGAEQAPKPAPRESGPMETLFANYVLAVIGHLPPDKEALVASLAPKLQASLKTQATEWKAIVAEGLQLSATIDVAILDLWFTNLALAAARQTVLAPEYYAQWFVAKYAEEGSRIDVWPEGALEAARARIASTRK